MECYKCGSEKELSVKKHDRHSIAILICRTCRRNQYHDSKRRKGIITKSRKHEPAPEPDTWAEIARKNYLKISARGIR